MSARERGTPLYRALKAVLTVLFSVFNRWEVEGRHHVPREGGVLLIANHTSYADPPIVGTACPRPVNFMAKAELFKCPLLGWVIRRTHAFPVRRGEGDRAALRRGVRLLREGRVLLIFPEGTRSPHGRLTEFEPGAAFLALATEVAVVPVALVGADQVLPRGSPIPRPAKLRVRFGPSVNLSDLRGGRARRQAQEEAGRRMEAALRALLPPERRG